MNSKLKILIPSGIVILLLLAFGIVSKTASAGDDKILKGVYINDISVGEMSKADAAELLNDKFNTNIRNKKISISYEDKNYTVDYKSLKAGYKVNDAVDKAYNYGKNGNMFSKLAVKWSLRNNPYKINMEFQADTSSLKGVMKKISSDINTSAKDAKLSFDGSKFTTTPDKTGIKVNETKLAQLINECVSPEIRDEKVEVPVEKVEAKVKESALLGIDSKISTFTTKFKAADANRTGNLRIASQAINGTVIMPGEVFSMNKALGPRLASKGYTEAPIIVKNTVVPSLAGGICQVTTTVYNAALMANFPIVQRQNHGLLVSYVGAGRDATISGDVIDMKFRNTNKTPLYIQAVMGASTLTINFYSANEHPGMKVEISSEVLEKLQPKTEYVEDPTLKKGEKVVDQKPISGAKSITYRKVYQDGVLVKTETISKDTYKTADGKIRIGTKSAETSSNNNGTEQPTPTPVQVNGGQ